MRTMSAYVPILTEAVTRAWGLDDPRVLSMLRAENQPGQYRRAAAVERRASEAGWPQEYALGNGDTKKTISRAMRRLERMDFRRGRGTMTSEEREVEACIAALAAEN